MVALTSPLGEIGLIAAFYLMTAVMTAVVSNAATAVMLTPVAIFAATQVGGLLNLILLVTATIFIPLFWPS